MAPTLKAIKYALNFKLNGFSVDSQCFIVKESAAPSFFPLVLATVHLEIWLEIKSFLE